MGDIKHLFPANDFKVVAKGAARKLEVGIIIGYEEDGSLCVFAGGTIHGKCPSKEYWLWMVEQFKAKLINGDYIV